ncbi:hypothetical protein SAMN04515648_1261 [Phyllobacterium sp. CL33Tsu]|nr:hypothetical protein SAMN04515648_1261 [Phyllobacterium sp. CL33Tsu]
MTGLEKRALRIAEARVLGSAPRIASRSDFRFARKEA